MAKFIILRILGMVPILLGVTFIVFGILSLTPGDPGRLILGQSATQTAVAELNHQLGYDRPFLVRFVNFVVDGATKFDFGKSYRSQKPVVSEIAIRFPTTLRLAFFSVILSAMVGIPLGILSAVKQYSIADTLATVTSLFLAAIPMFWLGMMLILVFALYVKWLPSNGVDDWSSYILPTVTLSLPAAAMMLRMSRSTMLETIRQDYIRTARAKGAPERQVIFKHALKNALLPVITVLGMNFGFLLGGAVVIETVFSIPGLGTMVLTGIRMKDVPIVMGSTLFLAAIFSLIMLLLDLAYAFVDPRIKARFSR
jgi:peptide/nickel transport system permease protein